MYYQYTGSANVDLRVSRGACDAGLVELAMQAMQAQQHSEAYPVAGAAPLHKMNTGEPRHRGACASQSLASDNSLYVNRSGVRYQVVRAPGP